MTEPEQPSPPEQCVHCGEASTCEDLCVWHFVVPFDVEDVAEAQHVETVQSLLLPCICCPCHTAIQKSVDDAGIVHCHLGCG